MKKAVNGSIVDIDNIELFERAEECILMSNMSYCNTEDEFINIDVDIDKYIQSYKRINKVLPYPLYGIEDNIKYAAVANCIKPIIQDEHAMWVNKGLFICIDIKSKSVLNLVRDTWSILKVDKIEEDNTDMDLYRDSIGYKEYTWLVNNVIERKATNRFYVEFMKEFVKACEWQPSILQKELADILTFGNIPEQLRLKENTIIDLENMYEYYLDIYTSGYRKTGESQYVISLVNDKDGLNIKPKYRMVYGYDSYVKEINIGKDGKRDEFSRAKKATVIGLSSIFRTLCSIKMAGDKNYFETFIGFIVDRNIIYMVNNRIFICKAFRQSESAQVTDGAELYGYDKGLVYFTKVHETEDGINKDVIYSYNIADKEIKVCKIQFRNK